VGCGPYFFKALCSLATLSTVAEIALYRRPTVQLFLVFLGRREGRPPVCGAGGAVTASVEWEVPILGRMVLFGPLPLYF
jgi:hypothetical protein